MSDRDRFSHFGLYAEDRVREPMVKENGEWRSVSWEEAIAATATALKSVVEEHGADELGVLMSPGALTEEYYLAQSMVRALGCGNIDHRLREIDFADDNAQPTTPQFGASPAEMEQASSILLIGSNIRHEAPILGHRVRKAWLAGAGISAINPIDFDFHFKLKNKQIVAPQNLVDEVAGLVAAVSKQTGKDIPGELGKLAGSAKPTDELTAMATELAEQDRSVVFLGQLGMSHPQAASLRQMAGWIAAATGSKLNLLPHGGNPVGAWRAGAVPHRGPGGADVETGLNIRQMLEQPRKAYLLWGFEPDFDIANPALVQQALSSASKVIAIASFATSDLADLADIILPLAATPESEGTLHRLDGESASVRPAGKASGQCKPGWKILRRLGEALDLEGFDQVSLSDLQGSMNKDFSAEASVSESPALKAAAKEKGLYRVGEVPMYGVDALCRRSEALQKTVHAQSSFVGINPADASALKLEDGQEAEFAQGGDSINLAVRITEDVPVGAAWLRSSSCVSRMLGDSFGPVSIKSGGGKS